jgi:hypothetical protein
MRRHKSLISRDDSYSSSSSYRRDVFVAYIPWSRRLRKEFYIRNIINGIDYFFERYVDIFFGSFLGDLKILDESILFEKLEDMYLEIRERHSIYSSFSRHICVLYSDKKIMDRSVDIGHLDG